MERAIIHYTCIHLVVDAKLWDIVEAFSETLPYSTVCSNELLHY